MTKNISKIKKNDYKFSKCALILVWLIVIFLFSSQAAIESSILSDIVVNRVAPLAPLIIKASLTFLVRKSAHIFLFFVLGVLIANLLASYKLKAKFVYVYSLMLVFAYGVTDEVHQLFVTGRSGEVRDILIDTFAGALGIALYLGLRRLYGTSKKTKNIVQ
jgi:VanZ family protein